MSTSDVRLSTALVFSTQVDNLFKLILVCRKSCAHSFTSWDQRTLHALYLIEIWKGKMGV